MNRTIHFLSGLPRSGSTLLAALFRQNPALHAAMSSPVAVLCERLLPAMGQGEYASEFDDATRCAVLRGVMGAFYRTLDPETVVLDTNRAWCAHMGVLSAIAPDALVVACVRDPVWILDSFERVFRRNPFLVSKLHGPAQSATVFDRTEALMAPTGAFGAAWQALQDAYFGEHAHRLVLVDYDALAAEPLRVLAQLYDLLRLPLFPHDPARVGSAGGERFDEALHTPGLHAVRPRVERLHRRTVLPPLIVQRLANTAFWRDPAQNPGGAFVIAAD